MNLYDALKEAYHYAVDNSPKSDFAKNAKGYIEAILQYTLYIITPYYIVNEEG